MRLRFEIFCLPAIAGLLGLITTTACSDGSSSNDPTFNLLFEPPGGSGLASAEVNSGFAPVVAKDVTLPAGITVTGQVTDGSGSPLTGADVSYRRTASSPELDGDTTDGSGNYTVTVPAGTWVVVVDSGVDALGKLTQSRSVSATNTVQNFQFPLTVTVSGFVFESDAVTPIAGADLSFSASQTGADSSVTTDVSGFYTTDLVPDNYEVVVEPNDATHLDQRFALAVTGPTPRNFVLTLGIQVSGTVLRDDGTTPLLEDTKIDVILPENSSFFSPGDVTSNGADGTYVIDLVPPGTVIFEFKPPEDSGFPRQQITRGIVGPATETEDFPLAAGFLLTGTILQSDGATPEANVDVDAVPTNGSLPPEDDTTDGTGVFEISLFAGTYDLEIKPDVVGPGAVTQNLQLPEVRRITIPNDLPLAPIVLSAGEIVTGTVTEPDGLTVAPDIRVELVDTVDGTSVPGASDVTDGSGVYSFVAPVGSFDIEVLAENGPFENIALDPVPATVAVVSPGPVTRDITLSIATTGSTVVQGTVFASDGITPVANTDIVARDNQTGDVIGVAVTDVNGDYLMVLVQ